MKKYFIVETEEEVTFGDSIQLTFNKELEDGDVTFNKKVEFTEDNVDVLIEMGFIEEREVEEEDNNDLLDFDEPCEELSALEEDFEALEKRVEKIEGMIKEIYGLVKSNAKETKLTAQLKKDK